jgi:adenosylcobinamide-GDP ribazoletransferase
LIGTISAGILLLASLFWAPGVAVLLAMLSSVLITGAFHEDGLSDTCDGFGGGWGKEQILSIMKDSRIGAYGVIGIFFVLGLKFALLHSMPADLAAYALIVAHAMSRFVSTSLIFTHEYIRDDASSKVKPLASRMKRVDFLIGAATACISLALVPPWAFSLIISLVVLRIVLIRYFFWTLGGYTGDVLGAVQQVSELVVYLVISASVGK